MGRYVNCGIVTKIEVWTKTDFQKNKKAIMKRLGHVFDLNYYDSIKEEYNNYTCLYLNEEKFNKEFKELLEEMANIDIFRYSLLESIDPVEETAKFDEKKNKDILLDYLKNDFNLELKRQEEIKEYDGEKETDYKYSMEGPNSFGDETPGYFENYYYGTGMADDASFNDNLKDSDDIKIKIRFIPLYFDINKIESENIYPTLSLLNQFSRGYLKSNLKKTILFVIN